MPLLKRHMEEIGLCTELVCCIGSHPPHTVKPCRVFSVSVCIHPTLSSHAVFSVSVCNVLGVSRQGLSQAAREDGCQCGQAQDNACASSLWTSTSCAAGVPAACPALGSLVQSPDTQCRHILWASAVPQAPSPALSGCLLMVPAPREILLLCSVPNTQLSQTLLTSFLCTRPFIYTVHRLRVAYCSNVYFIKACIHAAFYSNEDSYFIYHLESSFSPLPIFCSSSALSHHLQPHLFAVPYLLHLLPTKELMIRLLSLHCAEQTHLTSDLTATSKDSGETQALRFLHKTQLTLRKTYPGSITVQDGNKSEWSLQL